MKQNLLHSIVIFLLAIGLHGAEITQDILTKELRKNSKVFETLSITKVNVPIPFEIDLGSSSIIINDKDEFDGFRFKFPKDANDADLIWYFNAPENWGNWYILPLSGEIAGGFSSWLDADKVYKNYDNTGEKSRLRILQTLESDYFKKGQEYLIWFRKVKNKGSNNKLRGVICLAKKNEDWNYKNIEKSLKLKPKNAVCQVEALGSRGGKILLDKEMFDSDYANAQIDSVFCNLRNTQNLSGGFFITMEIAIPACRSNVSITEIIKKYGVADFIRTSKEEVKVIKHAGGEPKDEDSGSVTTYYYDYFGFEVLADDPKKKVGRVVTHANNFSILTPRDEKAYFAKIRMKNLTVFHINKKEVGRLYYFQEDGKAPLIIKVPPIGVYRRENETLEYQGKGQWIWKSFFSDGTLARIIPFKNHRMNGIAKGYYRNGKKTFVASYKNGILDGNVVQYSEDGKERRHITFENGKQKKK